MEDGKAMHLSMTDTGIVFLPFSWSERFDSEQIYNPRQKCILKHTDRVFAILVLKEIPNE
jgi:hypothetical protein